MAPSQNNRARKKLFFFKLGLQNKSSKFTKNGHQKNTLCDLYIKRESVNFPNCEFYYRYHFSLLLFFGSPLLLLLIQRSRFLPLLFSTELCYWVFSQTVSGEERDRFHLLDGGKLPIRLRRVCIFFKHCFLFSILYNFFNCVWNLVNVFYIISTI